MRILYHHSPTPAGHGPARHDAAVAALRSAGHEVMVVGPCGKPRDLARMRCVSLLPLSWAVAKLAAGLRNYVRLRRAIHRFGPDLVYERYAAYGGAGVAAARRARVPVVLETAALYEQGGGRPQGSPSLARAVETAIVRSADRIIAATDAQKRALVERRVHPDRIEVCRGAVDARLFEPSWRRRSGRIVVGYLGNLGRGGAGLLLRLIRRVLVADDRVAFVVVGEAEWHARLAALIGRAEGRVRFLGHRDDEETVALLDGMDITLLPRMANLASPGPVLEYMAMETAVVAVDSPPVREVVDHGMTGMLVPHDDPSALADTVLRLVREPLLRHRLATNARRMVLQRYGWGAKTQRIADLYRGMHLADTPIRAVDAGLPLLP